MRIAEFFYTLSFWITAAGTSEAESTKSAIFSVMAKTPPYDYLL